MGYQVDLNTFIAALSMLAALAVSYYSRQSFRKANPSRMQADMDGLKTRMKGVEDRVEFDAQEGALIADRLKMIQEMLAANAASNDKNSAWVDGQLRALSARIDNLSDRLHLSR